MKYEKTFDRQTLLINVTQLFLIGCVIFMEYYQFQKGILPSSIKILEQGVYLILNITLLIAFNVILSLFFRRWYIVLTISSVICIVWSIANYYVMLFHGSPLCFSSLRNANAALSVLGEYDFTFSYKLVYILFCAVVMAAAIVLLYLLSRKTYDRISKKRQLLHKVATLLICATITYSCLFSGIVNLGAIHIGATWNEAIRDYGFFVVVIKDIENIIDPVEEPKGYNAEEIESIEPSAVTKDENKKRPNIILILNETLYDLNLDADIDYMEPVENIPGLSRGIAVSPMIGGGTNNSEYELLTSNSMYLLKSEAPFNYLELDNNTNNVIQYVEQFGYQTVGMHCASETNYSRQKAYPALGFDNVLLGEDDFDHCNNYGNRTWTDTDNYKDLIEVYEGNEKGPKFIYMLTMQNHGGWEQNEESYDLVHVKDDYGDLTDDLNEYLTSIYLSAQAFAELTEYFANVNEPTIIAMVGDHAPSFINQLTSQGICREDIGELTGRTVPYVIWANYAIDYPEFNDYISMTDFVPMIIESAGLPMSTYYQHIRDLQKEVPIRLSTGQYVDKNGKVGLYNEESEYHGILSQYYYMEYNSIIGGEECRTDLFSSPILKIEK